MKAINILWERNSLDDYPNEVEIPDDIADDADAIEEYLSDTVGATFKGYTRDDRSTPRNKYKVDIYGEATVFIDSDEYEDMDEDEAFDEIRQYVEFMDSGGVEIAELVDDEVDIEDGTVTPSVSVTVEVLAKDKKDAESIAAEMFEAIDCGELEDVSFSFCEVEEIREKTREDKGEER